MRISDWSSDVCSSDLARTIIIVCLNFYAVGPCSHPVWGWRKSMPVKPRAGPFERRGSANNSIFQRPKQSCLKEPIFCSCCERTVHCGSLPMRRDRRRSEEHTSELQSLMRISYAVFCLHKKTNTKRTLYHNI